MAKKNDAAPMQVQKGEATSQNKQVKKVLPNTKQPTREELEIRVKELEKQLSSVPKEFDKRIEYFTQKRELIRRLGKLDQNRENLSEHLERVTEIASKNDFETEDYYLNIEGKGNYSRTSIYELKNPVIIGELISFIIGRIDAKRKELKLEIEA